MIYVSEQITNNKHAGSKARNDVEAILAQVVGNKLGYVCDNKGGGSLFTKVKRALRLRRQGKIISRLKNETIFIQYPVDRRKIVGLFESIIKASKRNKTVLIIHDVEFIREKLVGKAKDREVRLFDSVTVLICHNRAMIEELQRSGVTHPHFVNLGIFDYLTDGIPANEHSFDKSVVYAGNLAKAPFLTELNAFDLGSDFVLYGINCPQITNPAIKYNGALSPEDLVGNLTQSFGLIWDSETVDGCTGKIGEYTRYNNPHKLSLYLVSGMPVIVWSQAAVADFVEKEKVGFVIDSLRDIAAKLDNLTEEEYEEYRRNADRLKQKLYCGEFMKAAIVRAIELCKG